MTRTLGLQCVIIFHLSLFVIRGFFMFLFHGFFFWTLGEADAGVGFFVEGGCIQAYLCNY